MSDDVAIGVVVCAIALIVILKIVQFNQRRKGRSLAALEAPHPSEQERVTAAVSQAGHFMDASILMVDLDELNRDKTQKVGACLYLVGAVDALCQHYKLSNSAFLAAAFGALRGFGLSEHNARGFCSTIPEMSVDPFGRNAMTEGGRTIQAWLSGSDPNAPIRLFELVKQWRANPEKGF